MKNLLITTALIGAFATSASAQTADGVTIFRDMADPMELHASSFIGTRVYASEAAYEDTEANGMQDGWEDIGEINDVILTRDGQVAAVLVDIGGFLGIGERQVAVDMGALRFVTDSATPDDPDDYFLVMTAARANLEDAPEYHWDSAATSVAPPDPAAAIIDPAAPGEAAPAVGATAPAHEVTVRDGYVVAAPEMLTVDKLTGAEVYDSTDAHIGEVSTLVVNTEGGMDHAVIDVGGFLGIGAKPVALPLDQIDILMEEDGSDLRVYVPMTKEQLKGLPKFEG
ncbi:PRC-barrel domain-containing protein [Phaeovulum sp.]|uniref:PRC-barrel domain-containing protein n=1 Tax=Phaeovulum sp. TaxID=2934796 RepID=UPI0039E64AFD